MNPHNPHQSYPPFPPHQAPVPYGYSPANAPSYQHPTTAYTYPASIPLQQTPPQPQQSQLPPSQTSHYFRALPQGAAASRHTPVAQRSQQQHQQPPSDPNEDADAPSSIPSTPGNGPGAPPPEANSPPDYEENLMNALRDNNETGNDGRDIVGNDNDHDNDDDDEDAAIDEPIYQLPPPPEAIFANEVELEKAVHAWSLEHGYELVRRASKKNARGLLYKRYFHCSKHGKVGSDLRADGTPKLRANRTSHRTGCPMSLAAVSVDPSNPNGNWQIRHRKPYHNHPAVDAIKLAGHRRRARMGGVETAIDGLFAIGTNTGDVLKFLQRTHPDGLFSRNDVANMKIKFKKFGSCARRQEEETPSANKVMADAAKTGFPSACESCRQKKIKCDSIRPACGSCMKTQTPCHYSHEAHPPRMAPLTQMTAPPQPSSNTQQHSGQMPMQGGVPMGFQNGLQQPEPSSAMRVDYSLAEPGRSIPQPPISNTASINQLNARQAEQVLAALASFQKEHVKPSKLSLDSSSIVVLASSTSGNGDSYKLVVPRPFTLESDWNVYKDNFFAAAVKENALDVLSGDKKEPTKPPGEVHVEVHNEYIKQLAVYTRRNEMLKIGIKESLHPSLWTQIKSIRNAHAMWNALEDMCMPRGSDQAYIRFNDLLNITLQASGSLDNYIQALEAKFGDFNQMSHHHDTRRATGQSATERSQRSNTGNGTFPEEMLCFVFLKNLGPQHQTLAANLCKKNNIGGYGSGERLNFKQLSTLVRRATDWEAQRNGSAR